MRKRQSGSAPDQRASGTHTVSSIEDADREWLSSLFYAFERNDRDIDTLVAWRTRRMAKAREAGVATRVRRTVAAAHSPGRRLEDFFRNFGRKDQKAPK